MAVMRRKSGVSCRNVYYSYRVCAYGFLKIGLSFGYCKNVLFCLKCCINNQAQVSVHLSNSCFEGFWRLFDAVRGFYINSGPESNRLFGSNGGCVYP